MINRNKKIKHAEVMKTLPSYATIDEMSEAVDAAREAIKHELWTDLSFHVEREYNDYYIVLTGNRLETDAELARRILFEEEAEREERREYERLKAKYERSDDV